MGLGGPGVQEAFLDTPQEMSGQLICLSYLEVEEREDEEAPSQPSLPLSPQCPPITFPEGWPPSRGTAFSLGVAFCPPQPLKTISGQPVINSEPLLRSCCIPEAI